MRSNGLFILILSTILFAGLPSFAQTPDSDNLDLFYLCKNSKGSVRWLRAYRTENSKCHTVYSKEGYLQVISSATYTASCVGVLHNVRKNIEEGGFKCGKMDSYSFLEVE
ncbi:MAG: hypothetical protein K0R29_101 [Pseudobdellovibrio sp.]|jgi:hypothetical protein|nr:hypothetical protein [Pseudobdellovibrio sp.]